jgi:hypothetical protein
LSGIFFRQQPETTIAGFWIEECSRWQKAVSVVKKVLQRGSGGDIIASMAMKRIINCVYAEAALPALGLLLRRLAL